MAMPKGRDETKQNVVLCRPFNLNFPMPRSFTTGCRLPMSEDKEKSVIIVQGVTVNRCERMKRIIILPPLTVFIDHRGKQERRH